MGILLILAAEGGDTQASSFDWKILLVFGLVIGVMFIIPRLLRKSRQERELLEKQYNRELNGNTSGVRFAADQILLQVVETGREINGVLDTKIRVLNKLIKDADDAARRLESLTGAAALHSSERLRSGKNSATATQPVTNTAQAAALAALASLRAAAGNPADPATPLPTLAEAAVFTPSAAAPAPPAAQESADTGSGRWKADIRSRIRAYAEEGRSADEIARLTRLSKAEVNLMLDLLRSEQGH